MSDVLIQSLQEQIQRLNQENATLRAEAKDRRLKAKTFKDEVDQHAKTIEELTKERDTLKGTLEARPSEVQAQLEEYKGKLRERDHRDKFRSLAKESGVNEKALDDLWQLSGYKADADEIDESKIKAAISTALQGRDWLKSATAPDGANGTAADAATQRGQAAQQATRSAGPGASRGTASGKSAQSYDEYLAEKYPNPGRLA